MDTEYGKLSPLNAISILEMIVRKTDSVAEQLWVFNHIKFLCTTKLLTVKDFSVRTLEGSRSGTIGAVWLYVAKKKLRDHLLADVFGRHVKPSEFTLLTESTQDHETYLQRCGAGCVKADLSWQGPLGPTARKCMDYLTAIYSPTLDPNLKSSLKSTRNPADILTHAPFLDMVAEINDKYKLENPAEGSKPADGDAGEHDGAPEGDGADVDVQLEHVLTTDQVSLKDQIQDWFEVCTKKVDVFVKLLPTNAASAVQQGAALAGTFMGSDIQRVGLYLDTKKMGESSTQPHIRPPAYRATSVQHAIQSFVIGRSHPEDPCMQTNTFFSILLPQSITQLFRLIRGHSVIHS